MVSAFSRFIALVTDFFTSVITLDGVPIIAFVGSIVLILIALAAWRIVS